MAQTKEITQLEQLVADEVSLVAKGANGRKFLLLKAEEEPTQEDRELAEQFEDEILKADLDEALSQPFEGETELADLVEKGALSPRAMLAVKTAVRSLRGFERELPSDFMDMIRGLMGASQESAKAGKKAPGRDPALSRYTKSDEQEDEQMADDVKKTAETEEETQVVPTAEDDAASTTDEVTKAKKQEEEDDEEEENGKKKVPPFMKKTGKVKAEKEDTSSDDVLAGLSGEARARVEAIFKSHEEMEQRNAQILKAQEETQRELAEERDARKLEQAVQKAATDYPNLPIESKVLGAIVKKANEEFTEKEAGEFERVLQAADNAIAESKSFAEANGNTFAYGETASAYQQLTEIAKSMVEKSDEPMSEAAAFTKALAANPKLYNDYMAERAITPVEG